MKVKYAFLHIQGLEDYGIILKKLSHSNLHFPLSTVRPRIETQPEDTDVLLGQSVLLNCSARGLPEPLITWTKNDEPLDLDNARFQLLENGSLLIQDVMINDTGDYKCNATNELGFLQTDDAMLMVNSEYMQQ